MLFSSPVFIFLFLPCVLLFYYALIKRGSVNYAFYSLVAFSLLFYGWWKPAYLILIVTSVLGNYFLGTCLGKLKPENKNWSWVLVTFGVSANLASIGYFKYANFFIDNLNQISGTAFLLEPILLPLAISFFTFQQIAYLVDIHRGEPHESSFRNYALFVTFFPQLIAGPIVHHKEMLPQFLHNENSRNIANNLALGLSIFAIGLFKKVVIADGVAGYSDAVFNLADNGETITFFDAWLGSLAYTCQLYFDFSGYSDMAIGLARLFGIRLPLNFNSPYKSRNIIEFWRRWHMTLSRFLRDYLYIPLGGSRGGRLFTYRNLFIVMFLGGLWHGAGWTFVLWGSLHGVYLLINHAWQAWRKSKGLDPMSSGTLAKFLSTALTFLAVVVAWVYFRAETVDAANRILIGMTGINGAVLPENWATIFANHSAMLASFGITFGQFTQVGVLFPLVQDALDIFGITRESDTVGSITGLVTLSIPMLIMFLAPNTQQIFYCHNPAFEIYKGEIKRMSVTAMEWHQTRYWAVLIAIIGAYGCFGGSGVTRFLYFNF